MDMALQHVAVYLGHGSIQKRDQPTGPLDPSHGHKLAHFEHNAGAHHLLGQIELLQGNPTAAAEWYAEAWMLQPDDLSLLDELARVQYEAGKFADCYESVKQVQLMGTASDRLDLQLMEARCLALLGRTTESRNLYLKLSQKKRGVVRYDPVDLRSFMVDRKVRSTAERSPWRKP